LQQQKKVFATKDVPGLIDWQMMQNPVKDRKNFSYWLTKIVFFSLNKAFNQWLKVFPCHFSLRRTCCIRNSIPQQVMLSLVVSLVLT